MVFLFSFLSPDPLCKEFSDCLLLVAAQGVVEEGQTQADDGAHEEAGEDQLLLDLHLGDGTRQEVGRQAKKGYNA